MKKTILLIIITTAAVFSCDQTGKSAHETVKKESVNSIRRYTYSDSHGKHVIIQNSFPRGAAYIDPDGKEFFRVIFWSRVMNERDEPLELKIHFTADRYEVPGLPGNYFKILVPLDTMTTDKENLYDYGMNDLRSFLDKNLHNTSFLERTVKPKDSTGFYIVLLRSTSDRTPGGVLRTGFHIKGQQLFYRISRYDSKQGLPLLSEKEIPCGTINIKDLIVKEQAQ